MYVDAPPLQVNRAINRTKSPSKNTKKVTRQDTYSITVIIEKLASKKGVIILQLKNEENQVVVSVSEKITGEQFKTTLTDIPAGTYGIRFLHDENENQKMDFNLFGIPKERYGFSNNVVGFMKAPSFEKTLFSLSKDITKKLIAR